MAMYRIICTSCGWKTKPSYKIFDCIREKEKAHGAGLKAFNAAYGIYHDAHDSAFTDVCPKCGGKTKREHRWFSSEEIKES